MEVKIIEILYLGRVQGLVSALADSPYGSLLQIFLSRRSYAFNNAVKKVIFYCLLDKYLEILE